MAINVNMDGLSGYCDFCLAVDDTVLAAGIYEHSSTKTKALGARFGNNMIKVGSHVFYTKTDKGFYVEYLKIPMGSGRDHFYYALATSKDVDERFLVTSQNDLYHDFYNYLMRHYKLPLLETWIPEMLQKGIAGSLILNKTPDFISEERRMSLHGKPLSLSDILVYDMKNLTDNELESMVSELLQTKRICISKKPMRSLNFKDFDDYINQYGSSLIKNLEEEITPLCDLKGTVDTIALKHKRLYPQQAACTNGIIALKKAGIHYGIANEGMGCGKTIQSVAAIEGYFINDYLQKHPGKTLVDAYQDNVIHYRNIIMAPGHLVEKWGEEIKNEIPFAKVTIIRDFSQLITLHDNGKKRNGKEFYILSKDFCKLGSQISPIPTKVKRHVPITVPICKDCYTNDKLVYYRIGTGKMAKCPNCNGHNFMNYRIKHVTIPKGMICPNCNEVLLSSSNIQSIVNDLSNDEGVTVALTPADFAKKTSTNARCVLCDSQLWGVNSKPIDVGGKFSHPANRKPKWYKISHFRNKNRKTKETAFLLKGYEDDYIKSHNIPGNDYKVLPSEYGPRKVAPAEYIKKYLKGFFDFCLLDECHKYEGAGTAQSNAAHALSRVSDFTLGLTGTISNGSAGSFFWLLWMLDPKRMKSMGYYYSSSDCTKFCQRYGCVETVYEYNDYSETYNSTSRGRQLTTPKVKPGISPLLYIDFLLDRCVMLDITDMSKFLPELEEKIVTCSLPEDIAYSYRQTIGQLKEASHTKVGRGSLSAMLNFGLSYPDKPYGRKNITSPYMEDEIIATVDNYEYYSSIDALLPKEEKMVEIINKEISEGRGCFVYATYTGDAESNIMYRLQSIIEKHCNLKGRVQILQAASPAPLKREAWIKQKASEGAQVFICNPKVVETGLDFCFTYKGAKYNFPTIIFMQMSYEMAVIWQASRRAYRLNQWEECRNYYLAYEGTLQTAALEIMAEKQVATSAIQGKFSSEGLAAMAKGVDTRTQLAAALAKNDMSDRKSLENMFDTLNAQNNTADDTYRDYVPPKTYFELVGLTEMDIKEGTLSTVSGNFQISLEDTASMFVEQTDNTSVLNAATPDHSITEFPVTFENFMNSFMSENIMDFSENATTENATETKKRKHKSAAGTGQMTFTAMFGI